MVAERHCLLPGDRVAHVATMHLPAGDPGRLSGVLAEVTSVAREGEQVGVELDPAKSLAVVELERDGRRVRVTYALQNLVREEGPSDE